MNIFLTHASEAFERYYGPEALAALGRHGLVRRNPRGTVLEAGALIEAASGCDVIVADRATKLPAIVFEKLPGLVTVHRCAMDISTIDVEAASCNGILVTRATAGFVDAVAELTIGLMINLARGINDAVIACRAGHSAPVNMGVQLAGSSLGIVGFGAIGQRVAELGRSFRLDISIHDPKRLVEAEGLVQREFAELLARSRFVVCLASATPETRHLFGAAAFRAMAPGSFFLNLARGSLVDEAALAAALTSGHLAGAALDVGSAPDEMPPAGLAALRSVIATPHIGGLTQPAVLHQAFDTVRQVEALAAGRVPEGAVNLGSATRLTRLGVSGQ